MSSSGAARTIGPGTVIGDYEVTERLGEGGQGAVFAAKHTRLGRKVALKIPVKALAAPLLSEARMAAQIESPNVVRVEHVQTEGEVPFLVLERCEGGSLAGRLEANPQGLPLAEVRRIAVGVLAGLEAAHRKGVVHRDLKPSNILFDAKGTPKVTDFGAGLALHGSGDGLRHTLEQTPDHPAGTPLYMAPEQLKGDGAVDGRADLFSFGKVLYQMLTGKSPQSLRRPSSVRTELNPGWDEVVFRLVEEDPAERFASAADAREAVEAAFARAPKSAGGAAKELPGRRRTEAVLSAVHLASAGWLIFMALRSDADRAGGILLRGLAWGSVLALPASFAAAESLIRAKVRVGLVVRVWIGAWIVALGLVSAMALARAAHAEALGFGIWALLGYLAVIAASVGASVAAAAIRAADPPPPLDHETGLYQDWVRVPTQVAVFLTVAWAIGIWLRMRPEDETPGMIGTAMGAVLAWRLAGPEVRLRIPWPRLLALVSLGGAVLASIGIARLQTALFAESIAWGSLALGGVMLGGAFALAVLILRRRMG